MTNVFISWSGQTSKEIAEELRNWIPSVLQFAKPYYTPHDIEKGSKWGSEISQKLADSNVGIVCLTKDNYTKPWILFEAGALSKDLEKSKVCSILFGMDNTDIAGPLTTFQTTSFVKSDVRKLMSTINTAGGENALSEQTFTRVFDKWWPDLKEKIDGILANESPDVGAEIRTDREILEEVLALARLTNRKSNNEDERAGVPHELVRDLAKHLDGIFDANKKHTDSRINDHLETLARIANYLDHRSTTRSDEVTDMIERLSMQIDDFIPF